MLRRLNCVRWGDIASTRQTLRTKELSDDNLALQSAGIKPSLHSRAEIVEMAEAILLKDS